MQVVAPGELTERFSLLRRIGQGGMGVVYEALDRERGVRVALKTLPKARPNALYHFKNEFRSLADLMHRNLVPLYELISADERWFFTMELLDDAVDFISYVWGDSGAPDSSSALGTLGAACGPRTPDLPTNIESLPVRRGELRDVPTAGPGGARATSTPGRRPAPLIDDERLRDAIRQLVRGLRALHRTGRLHRDVKPSNVLVRADGTVVILDFGLVAPASGEHPGRPNARENLALGPDDHAGHVVGTVPYMSPEQGAGEAQTPASDWYAVGCLLFEALTGELPFAGRTPAGTLWNKRTTDGDRPSARVSAVPEDLDGLCAALLQRDPAARPTAEEILAMLGARKRGAESSSVLRSTIAGAAAAADAPFVGRARQLDVLRRAYDRTRGGETAVVRVHGGSGVGKSALVERFLEDLRREEPAVILRGRCYQQESVPYKAVDSLVDALSHYLVRLPRGEIARVTSRDGPALARVFPVLTRARNLFRSGHRDGRELEPRELRRRAFNALRRLLSAVAARHPLVLAIDDLQWGDTDSAHLLAEVLRPPLPPAVLLIVAHRDEDAECLRALHDAAATDDHPLRCADDLSVDPLTDSETRELATRLLEGQTRNDNTRPSIGDTRTRAEQIVREAGGSPYFVHELVEHLRAGQDPLGRLGEADGALRLERAVRTRVDRLPADARALLEAVAVAGQPVRLRDAGAGADLAAIESNVVPLLRAARLVHSGGPALDDVVEPYHDRIRETVAAHVDPERLPGVHRRLALAFERAGSADAETIARHFDRAGDEAQAAHHYASGADEARLALAFDRAASLYRRSLQLHTPEPARERRMRVDLSATLANAGRGAEAAREYLLAAEGAEETLRIDLQRRAAYHFYVSGHLEEGRAVLGPALERFGLSLPTTPARALVPFLARRARLWLRGLEFTERAEADIPALERAAVDVTWTAAAGLGVVNVIVASDFQTRNLLLALECGEPYRIARALAWEAALLSNMGAPARRRTERLLDRAATLARRIGHPHAIGLATLAEGLTGFTWAEWRRGREQLERAETILRDQCTGVTWELGTAHAFMLWCMFYLGDVAQMSARSSGLLAEAQERGDLYAATNLATFTEPLARLIADDPDGARAIRERFMAQWTPHAFHVQHMVALMGATYTDLYTGDAGAAQARMDEQWRALARSQLLRAQVPGVLLTELRARTALASAGSASRPAKQIRLAQRCAARIERTDIDVSRPLAALLRGQIALARGARTRAARELERAAAGFDRQDMSLFAAAARLRRADLDDDHEAHTAAAAARAWMLEQGVVRQDRLVGALVPVTGEIVSAT